MVEVVERFLLNSGMITTYKNMIKYHNLKGLLFLVEKNQSFYFRYVASGASVAACKAPNDKIVTVDQSVTYASLKFCPWLLAAGEFDILGNVSEFYDIELS